MSIKPLAGERSPAYCQASGAEPRSLTRYMNTLYGTRSMCYACEPRVPTLNMPTTAPRRLLPTGPQYFTFDPLPEVERSSSGSRKFSKTSRIKKRSRRVLYPPVVKRYYPNEERSYAKRLLFILLTVIFVQVYSAEEDLPLLVNPSGCSVEGFRESHCELLLLLDQPLNTTLSLEIMEAANATAWHGGDEEASDSTVDITQFLEQSPAAF